MLVYQRVISAGADWSHRRGSCTIAPTAIVWIPGGTHQLRRSASSQSPNHQHVAIGQNPHPFTLSAEATAQMGGDSCSSQRNVTKINSPQVSPP